VSLKHDFYGLDGTVGSFLPIINSFGGDGVGPKCLRRNDLSLSALSLRLYAINLWHASCTSKQCWKLIDKQPDAVCVESGASKPANKVIAAQCDALPLAESEFPYGYVNPTETNSPRYESNCQGKTAQGSQQEPYASCRTSSPPKAGNKENRHNCCQIRDLELQAKPIELEQEQIGRGVKPRLELQSPEREIRLIASLPLYLFSWLVRLTNLMRKFWGSTVCVSPRHAALINCMPMALSALMSSLIYMPEVLAQKKKLSRQIVDSENVRGD
jgi:hypothetical protein